MANILLVEPDYRSKFPPLGLMRISSYHKHLGDSVTFVRGKSSEIRKVHWHKVYVSSLFTYELPRTVQTIKYYSPCVDNQNDLIVGGIGATLIPEYIRNLVKCNVIEGSLDRPNMIGSDTPRIDKFLPDYSLIDADSNIYQPEDSYFCRVTVGCTRKCNFCAVSTLEPKFGYLNGISTQIRRVEDKFGERQNLVLMDNNILASERFEKIINEIRDQGFYNGAKRKGKRRSVDFNQGIDARLIDHKIAKLLSTINISPIRLAFDIDAIKSYYTRAVHFLAKNGFHQFTTYVMYNYRDTPLSFYNRLKYNIELSKNLDIRVSGFPMKYIPIQDVHRRHISDSWNWRYLRGVQCILLATHGIVSPNPDFFSAAFGNSYENFMEIVSMPDRYIIHRQNHINDGAKQWRKLFRKLSKNETNEFMQVLSIIHRSSSKSEEALKYRKFQSLLEHYKVNPKAT